MFEIPGPVIVRGVKLFQYMNHIIQQMRLEFWWGSVLECSLLEGKEGRRIMVEWVQRMRAQ
jgi:hypothetical protein